MPFLPQLSSTIDTIVLHDLNNDEIRRSNALGVRYSLISHPEFKPSIQLVELLSMVTQGLWGR
jgi:hypothetical protein